MFLALASSSTSRPGTARQPRLDRPRSTCPALQARLYRNGSASTSLHRHCSTAQLYRQAQGNPLKEAGRSQTKPQVRGDYATSGCRCFWRWPRSPTSRPGTAPQARLFRHSAGTALQGTALQAWFHSGMARQAHLHSTGAALHRLYSGPALYRHGSTGMAYTGKALQAWL